MGKINVMSDTTGKDIAEKLETMNKFIAAMASNGGGITVKSWADVQSIVRLGLAGSMFRIGDQLVSKQNGLTRAWDVIGIDHDTPADKHFTHSMTLQLHGCLNGICYNEPQALYYCETELPAGTYNFTLLSGYDIEHGGGKTYQFTLTQAVPAGGQITFSWGYNTQASAANIKTYQSSTSAEAIETVSISEGSGGTSLGTADGSTPNMNHTQYARFGSNLWENSNVRTLLNSDGAAGEVWTPKTKFDRPPSWVNTKEGFMNGMETDFLSVIGAAEKKTAINTFVASGGISTTADKFFLLSTSEVYAEAGNGEGKAYPYYADYSDLTSPSKTDDGCRVKYWGSGMQNWFLRSAVLSSGSSVYDVTRTGSVNASAGSDFTLAPACCII